MSFIYSFNPFTGNLDKVVNEVALRDFISDTYVPYANADKAVNLNNQVLSNIAGVGNSKVVFSTGAGALTTTPITSGDGVFWNRTGNLLFPVNAADELQVDGHVGFGVAPNVKYGVEMLSSFTGATDGRGLSVGFAPAPSIASAKEFSAIGGFCDITFAGEGKITGSKSTSFGSGLSGLTFSVFNGLDREEGSVGVEDIAGISVVGLSGVGSHTNAKNIYGIFVQPWWNIFGVTSVTADNMYGVYIGGGSPTSGTIEKRHGLWIENSNIGTENYQLVLSGVDDGSGLFIGGTDRARLYQKTVGAAELVLDTAVGFWPPQDFVVDCGTSKTIRLVEPVFEDQQINIGNTRWQGANEPSWVDYKGGQVVAFGASTVNRVYFNLEFSHKIKSNSDAYFHIHVVRPLTGNGSTVDWELTVCYANQGAAFPGVTTILKTQTVGVVGDHEVLVFTGVFTSGSEFSGIAICSLARLGTGSYDEDMYMLFGDAHLEIDTIGTRLPFTK